MRSEAAERIDFSAIRYAQAWEDADVMLAGLDVRPGDVCVSIASAGDNTLALLTKNPSRVIALDLSAAQLACLELRVAAYRTLTHAELLELVGSRPSDRRPELYARCRSLLSVRARELWDGRPADIRRGIGGAGKFEKYLALFRRAVLPLVHRRATVMELLRPKTADTRRLFYDTRWNTWRWRLVFRLFFSRFVMARLGRDPECFHYVTTPVADAVLERTRHALTELDPSANPYIHWILTGTHGAIAAMRSQAGAFRHHPREHRSARVVPRLDRGIHGTVARMPVRSVQPQQRVRIHVGRALSATAENDSSMQPSGRAPGLLEPARAAPPAGSLRRQAAFARGSRRQAARVGSRVLL